MYGASRVFASALGLLAAVQYIKKIIAALQQLLLFTYFSAGCLNGNIAPGRISQKSYARITRNTRLNLLACVL